jgi:hypothetical protein
MFISVNSGTNRANENMINDLWKYSIYHRYRSLIIVYENVNLTGKTCYIAIDSFSDSKLENLMISNFENGKAPESSWLIDIIKKAVRLF